MRIGPKVLVFPAWRDNPFLNLLQLDAYAHGFQFLGATSWQSLELQLARLQSRDVFHIHWTSPILQPIVESDDAARRLETFKRVLSDAQKRGVRIVWTIHNRLPHELTHFELERHLYVYLGEVADAVHVMAPDTARVVSDIVELPLEKVVQIPHSSYRGVYDEQVNRAQARAARNLDRSDRGILFLGQIRPYKGLDVLVQAASIASRSDDRLVLMLAGQVKEMHADEFLSLIPAGLRTEIELGFVPDEDLSSWFSAADVAVFPYRAILNSGSVHLAATFHVPVILPGEPHLKSQFAGQKWVKFFDLERPTESIAEMLSDPHLFHDVNDNDFAAYNAPISPWRIARQYREMLERITAKEINQRNRMAHEAPHR